MSVISLTEAAKLSNNVLVEGIIADIVTTDQFFEMLPFVVFEGLSYTFTREATLAAADFASVGTLLNQAKYTAGATFQNVNVNLSTIIADIILDGDIEDQLSETNDQLAVQVSSKAKQLARTYMNAVVNSRRPGSGLTQSNNGPIGIAERFDGMAAILDAEQGNVDDVNHPFYNAGASTQTLQLVEDDPSSPRVGRDGRAFTLEDLDDVIDRVTIGKPDFIMMNAREIRTLRTLLRNTGGGTDAAMIQSAGLGSPRPTLMYQDIPVIRNDFISKADAVEVLSTTLDKGASSASVIEVADASSAFHSHVLMRGTDGVLYRWDISSGAGTTTLGVSSSGQFFDPEQNKLVSRVSPVSALFVDGQEALVAERVDGSSVYVGCLGEFKGLTGFTSAKNSGLKMEYVGPRESENAYQYRLKWRVSLSLYNRLALARMVGVLPLGA